jgi:chromosome segregation ATPase
VRVEALEDENRQLKEQIKSLDTQHAELVAECEKDEHRIHELENDNTDLKHKLEIATASQSGQKSELQDVCDKLEEENKNLHQQLTEIDEKSAQKEKK